MGIFGSRKKTYVSSVVYNMAGDEMNRPDYLKTTIFSSVMNQRPSISDDLVGSYLEGPGMRFRKFARWAHRTDYGDVIGLVTGSIQTGNSIDQEVLQGELPASPGSTASLQSATIGEADYTFWADQYVAENFQERLTSAYESDFNEATNEITITWEDTSTSTFTPVGYDPAGMYLYAVYTEVVPEVIEPPVEGDPVVLDPLDPWPDITGWTEIDEETIDDVTYTTYERETYMGQAPDRDATYTLKETMIFAENNVTGDREYRIDTQITYHNSRSPMKVFIYKRGTGNTTLDAMFAPSDNLGSFFPFIPFRLDNKFVSETYLPEVYEQAKKGYKKATTGKFDEMIESLEDNEDLDDIDYAYCVFGVSLNVIENASRKYVYQFFKEIMDDFPVGGGDYTDWQDAWNAAHATWVAWAAWSTAQQDEDDPLFGTPEPSRTPYPVMPASSLRVSSGSNPVMNYDITISWSSMQESAGSGLLKPDAKRDELWFSIGTSQEYEEIVWGEENGVWQPMPGNSIVNDDIYLNWQVTPNSWRRLRIVGLKHRNLIYGGKSVDISAKEALEDGEESGFIIPLHEGVYRSMGLVDGTQMATACSFMVFNCYQVVKKKWYQTGIFQIIVIIIIIVVSIYTGGAGAAGAGGVLGTNATVGAALGLAGTAAIVAGAIANALAAMLITRLISVAAVELFGDKWGAIIGAIVAVIALQVGTAMAQGQTMANSFSGLMRADNIMRLMDAVNGGYQQYLAASTAEYMQQTQQVLEDYKEESRKIREAWMQNIGTNHGIIDPLAITEAFGVTQETMDSFLQRTLMTGSDVAELSLDMLTNFVKMTLSTELPT